MFFLIASLFLNLKLFFVFYSGSLVLSGNIIKDETFKKNNCLFTVYNYLSLTSFSCDHPGSLSSEPKWSCVGAKRLKKLMSVNKRNWSGEP